MTGREPIQERLAAVVAATGVGQVLEVAGWKRPCSEAWRAVEGLYRLHARAFIASTTADGFRCLMYLSVVASEE